MNEIELQVETVDRNPWGVVVETIRGELTKGKDGYTRQWKLPWARVILPASTEIKEGDLIRISVLRKEVP